MRWFPLLAVTLIAVSPVLAKGSVKKAVGPVASPAPKAAPSRDVLGITLGTPFSLPECGLDNSNPDFDKYRGHHSYEPLYTAGKYGTCYQARWQNPPYTPESTDEVMLAFAATPQEITSDGISANIIDGNVESMTLTTHGVQGQTEALAMLTEKYGTPTTLATDKVQNRMGASYDRITATWAFSDLSVAFLGIGSKIDYGIIVISTPKSDAASAAKRTAEKATAPKL